MRFTIEELLLLISILLFISILTSKTGRRFGIPTLILFLAIGMLAGSDGIGGIYFDDPKLSQFVGVVALNFILFSGGLETQWESVKPVLWRGVVLSTFGVLITAFSVGLFVYWTLGFSLSEGLLLGAIISSTDAAAVFSILRSKNIGLKRNLRPLLELESGSNDPMAFLLTTTFIFMITASSASVSEVVLMFFQQMIFGTVAGIGMGFIMVRVLNRIDLNVEGLYPVLVMALMFFTFSATDKIGGNGFLAVYLAAIYLGNQRFIHKKSILKFYDGQAWLMQIVMFLTLGLLVFPHEIVPLIGTGLLISAFLIFAARPLAVYICMAFFKMKNREKLFVSWVGLRGAVPIVFATYPLIAGIEKAGMIFNLVFFITLTSVLLQGTSLHLVAKWLRLVAPEKIKRKFPIDIELSEDFKNTITEVEIDHRSASVNQPLIKLHLPKSVLIVMINRNERYITPNGNTEIEAGDRILLMADNPDDAAKSVEILTAEHSQGQKDS